MIGAGSWRPIAQSLRHRNHRLFNITLLPALLSLWAQRTGIGWLTWELTESPSWLGIVAAADLLPAVVLAPFAGVISDRVNALTMMRLTQGLIMVHAGVLWALTATGMIDIWLLFALSLVTGLNQPFSTAGRLVFYARLVPKEDLGTAIAINSTIFNLGRALGPALAGVLIAGFSVGVVFFLNFAAFLAHEVNLYRIRMARAGPEDGRRKTMWGELGEGLRYTARHSGIAPLLILLFVAAVTSRPVSEMMPGFAGAVFERGAEGLGWLLSALGLGGVAGAAWLAQRGPVRGLTTVVRHNTLAMGAAIAAFALAGSFWAGLFFALIIGFTHVVTGTGTQTLMQTAVAGEMRGRVMSLYALVFRGAPAIGAIVMGWIADHAGLEPTVAGAGILCMAAWAWVRGRRRTMAGALEIEHAAADERESRR